MATTLSNLSDLTQRLARQEAELFALRQQLQGQLPELRRRREELRAELRTVEAAIAAVAPNDVPPERPAQAPTAAAGTATRLPAQPATRDFPSLPAFLLQLVGEAEGRPVTLNYLQQEVVRRQFPTKSKHLAEMVGTRISDLVKRGRLRRDPAGGGLLLADALDGKKAPTALPDSPRPRLTRRKPNAVAAPSPKVASSRAAGASQPSLRAVVLAVLKKAGRTLSAQEIVERVQQAGYQSSSKSLKDVVWANMGKYPEVERDPKGGYRLKKTKG